MSNNQLPQFAILEDTLTDKQNIIFIIRLQRL